MIRKNNISLQKGCSWKTNASGIQADAAGLAWGEASAGRDVPWASCRIAMTAGRRKNRHGGLNFAGRRSVIGKSRFDSILLFS